MEQWKQFLQNYEISNHGNIRNTNTNHILKTSISNGYVRIRIRGQNFRIHRLVAQYFIKNPSNLTQVNHIDGNKQNNHYNNLQWLNNRENTIHAFDNGLAKSGEKHRNSKLTNEVVLSLKMEHNDPDRSTINQIAETHGVHWSTIRDIFSGKTWKRINPEKNKELFRNPTVGQL